MESPYRTAEPVVTITSSRSDRRCGPSTGCSPPGRARGRLTVVREVMTGVLSVTVILAGLVAMAGGVQACVMLSSFSPQPVLLRVPNGAAAPVQQSVTPAPVRASPPTFASVMDMPGMPAGLLAATEPETHDPEALLQRARGLEGAGMPIQVVRVAVPPFETARLDPFVVNTSPMITAGDRSVGVEIATVPKYSLLARAGFRQGDVVLSINGYSAAGSAWTEHVHRDPERAGKVIVELLREGRRVVLDVTWPRHA